MALDSLLDSDAFSTLRDEIIQCITKIKTWDSVLLLGKLDLLSVFTVAQLEASFIDKGIKYQRKFGNYSDLDFTSHQGCIFIDAHGEFIVPDNIEESRFVYLKNIYSDFEMGFESNVKGGLIDVVVQAASIAESISPNGQRVKILRPWMLAGSLIRESFETSFDPAYIILKEHLKLEGSIKVVPITEVEIVHTMNITGFSEKMLLRLKKRWQKMEISERSMALSELVLPVFKNSNFSASKIEELFWLRVVPIGWKSDIASHISIISAEWNEYYDNKSDYAFTLMDKILTNSLNEV